MSFSLSLQLGSDSEKEMRGKLLQFSWYHKEVVPTTWFPGLPVVTEESQKGLISTEVSFMLKLAPGEDANVRITYYLTLKSDIRYKWTQNNAYCIILDVSLQKISWFATCSLFPKLECDVFKFIKCWREGASKQCWVSLFSVNWQNEDWCHCFYLTLWQEKMKEAIITA